MLGERNTTEALLGNNAGKSDSQAALKSSAPAVMESSRMNVNS